MTVDTTCPRCGYESESWRGVAIHFGRSHDGGHPLVEAVGADNLRRRYRTTSKKQLADELGVSRMVVRRALRDINVEERGNSEAAKLVWEQADKETKEQMLEPAHRASVKQPRFYTSPRGYEELIHLRNTVRVHRLAAVAWYGFDAVADKVVHHENNIPWDNREDNLRAVTAEEHARIHYRRGDAFGGESKC